MVTKENNVLQSLENHQQKIITSIRPPDELLEDLKASMSKFCHLTEEAQQTLLNGLIDEYVEGTAIYWQRTPGDRRLLCNWMLEATLNSLVELSRGKNVSTGEFEHIYLHVTDHIDVYDAPKIKKPELKVIKKELTVLFTVLMERLSNTKFEDWDHSEWDLSQWIEERPSLYEMLICNMFKAAFTDEPDEYMKNRMECISFDTIYRDLFKNKEIKNIGWLKPYLKRNGQKKGILYPVFTDPASHAA